MTRLQRLSLERVKKLLEGLHRGFPGPMYLPTGLDAKDQKRIEEEHREKIRKNWAEDSSACTEMTGILDAILAEKEEE
jgi:hypothetical protein